MVQKVVFIKENQRAIFNSKIKMFGLFPPFLDFTIYMTKFYSVLRVGAGMTQFDAYLASLF
jgi:hypothetical protein